MISNLGNNLERAFKDERNQGIKKGMKKGIEQKEREVVIKMIENNLDTEIIKAVVGVSEEYIEKIRKEMIH